MSEVLQRVRDHEQRLWIPGEGEVDLTLRRNRRAVQAYDDRLFLARHEITGDWVVFIKVSRDWIYPVIGIGPELPDDPEELTRRLYKADARRHGNKILDQINAHNERILAEKRYAADEAAGIAAEQLEYGMRRDGETAYSRIFVP